ncbi:MAG: Trk system potassium transporter TrkA [Pseudomonadota bacterium]
MKIIILGAGQVGSTLAELLVTEKHDITVVDHDTDRLMKLQSRIDIRTVPGHAPTPSTLKAAGAAEADMLIAVTNADEINMVACQVAYTLFRVPKKIARIRSTDYAAQQQLFKSGAFPIDVIISPEQKVSNYIYQLITHPEALQVLDLCHGLLKGVALKLDAHSIFCGQTLEQVYQQFPPNTVFIPFVRGHKPEIASGKTRLVPGMELFLLTLPELTREIIAKFHPLHPAFERIILAGGGNIGQRLASALESQYHVKLIERSSERCKILSQLFQEVVVLQGEASDAELLLNENIQKSHVFCAITNNDEANVMSAMLAKHLGAKHTMALVNNSSYLTLIQPGSVDTLISPQQATISSLLSHIRRGDIVQAHAIYCGNAEYLEIIAHGDKHNSSIIQQRICDIKLPPATIIAAVIQGGRVILNPAQHVVAPEDHLLVFVTDKRSIHRTEQLFQVNVTYF